MLKDKKIAIIGTGNMGEAILSGLVFSCSCTKENIICSDTNAEILENVKQKYDVKTTVCNIEALEKSDIIIYSVKPQKLASVLRAASIKKLASSKLIISVAAGVSIAAIEACLENKGIRIIRAMPNIACFVKEGVTAFSCGENIKEEDIEIAKTIFNSIGKTILIEKDTLMDAITGLSGSGPAYVFMIIDALSDAGVKMGLSKKDSIFLAGQTVMGAAKMLIETKQHPAILKDRVTSPGGTSIAGIHALEKGCLRDTLINAVESATLRAGELGQIMLRSFSNDKK